METREQIRMLLWVLSYVQARGENLKTAEDSVYTIEWADSSLEAFDARFPSKESSSEMVDCVSCGRTGHASQMYHVNDSWFCPGCKKA